MITVRNLRKLRGTAAPLDGLSADIAEGETVAITGPSGGGKTTLLRCLNGLEPFDEGSVHIAGFDLGPGVVLRPSDAVRLRSAVGMVFQELHLFPHLTVLENVTLAPRVVHRQAPATAERRARELLDRVGLGDRGGAYPHELSGGQKQRVAVVRALSCAPRVLLLDEPTSALDAEAASGLAATISELTRGRVTVVLVTHQRAFAESLADRVLELRAGVLHDAR